MSEPHAFSATRAAPSQGRERVILTFIFAALIHGLIILGVGFTVLYPLPGKKQDQVAVTLVHARNHVQPRKTRYLAQTSESGPGNTARTQPLLPPEVSGSPVNNLGISANGPWYNQIPRLRAYAKHPNGLRATAFAGHWHAITSRESRRNTMVSGHIPLSEAGHLPMLVARLVKAQGVPNTAFASAVQLPTLYGSKPLKKAESMNTRKSIYAAYLNHWREKIETVGSKNFEKLVPQSVRRGKLTLAVTLNADGTIRNVHLLRRSRHPVLNQAALEIIRMAAPFTPFPPRLRRRTHTLHFAYRWNFIRGRAMGGEVALPR